MCNAYSNFPAHEIWLMDECSKYATVVSLCLVLIDLFILCKIHGRYTISDTDRLFVFQLLIFGLLHTCGSLITPITPIENKIEWVTSAGMTITGTWGCLLSSATLLYNVLIASNRNKFDKFNHQRYLFVNRMVCINYCCCYCDCTLSIKFKTTMLSIHFGIDCLQYCTFCLHIFNVLLV